MSDQDKRCGTCKLWASDGTWQLNECAAPVPASVMVEDRDLMTAMDGNECPCWEAKE